MCVHLLLLPCRYQFSLAYFARMFSQCITDSGKSDDVPARLQLLSDYTTSFVFKSVSRCDGRQGMHPAACATAASS
jgi:hypothetical protein